MKIYIIIIFLSFSSTLYSQDYPYYGWYDVVVERSVEHLHKTLSSSNDITDKELLSMMKRSVLITEGGYFYNSSYFNQEMIKYIRPFYSFKSFWREPLIAKKIIKKKKVKGFDFVKIFLHSVNYDIYICFEAGSVFLDKETDKGIRMKKQLTFALYKYKYNKEKVDYDLEEFEIYNHIK